MQICRVEDVRVEGIIEGSVVHFHWVRTVDVQSSGAVSASGLGNALSLFRLSFLSQPLLSLLKLSSLTSRSKLCIFGESMSSVISLWGVCRVHWWGGQRKIFEQWSWWWRWTWWERW